MYQADREINRYRVDFTYQDSKYEDTYSSDPFDTEAEAHAYMDRVIFRASLRPDISLINMQLFFIDERVLDETGEFVTIEDITF